MDSLWTSWEQLGSLWVSSWQSWEPCLPSWLSFCHLLADFDEFGHPRTHLRGVLEALSDNFLTEGDTRESAVSLMMMLMKGAETKRLRGRNGRITVVLPRDDLFLIPRTPAFGGLHRACGLSNIKRTLCVHCCRLVATSATHCSHSRDSDGVGPAAPRATPF